MHYIVEFNASTLDNSTSPHLIFSDYDAAMTCAHAIERCGDFINVIVTDDDGIEMYKNETRDIKKPETIKCSVCEGSGTFPPFSFNREDLCSMCNGRGWFSIPERTA